MHLIPGQTYSVKVDYRPTIESGLKQKTHYLAVHTESVETYCSFKQQALKIGPTVNYELSAEVHGNSSYVDNYSWQCYTGDDQFNLAECSGFTPDPSKGSITFNADSGYNYFFYLTL